MKNSNEYLTEAQRNKLTLEELEIINVMQHGSSSVLRQMVNDAAMEFIKSRHVNASIQKRIPWYKKWWGALIAISGGIVVLASGTKAIVEFIRWILEVVF